MERARGFVVLASVVVLALLGLACSSSVGGYGAVKPPQEVLERIKETRNAMGCIANVLSTIATQTSGYLTVSVDIRGLSHLNSTLLRLDELYINVQNGGNSNAVQTRYDELQISDKNTQILLARVPVNSSKNGYRAIKMRGIFTRWQNNHQKLGALIIKLPPSQKHLAMNLSRWKAYFVIYSYSSAGQINMPTFSGPRCEGFDVTIRPQTPGNTAQFQTKICSPPEEITFPFNASGSVDLGMELRKALRNNPIPRNAAVLRNPKCCHGTKAISRIFAIVSPTRPEFHVVTLTNAIITECSCGTV